MQLIERYLQAVRFWLPAGQRDDIIEELRNDLNARVEEREADLGRRLTDDDLAAILRQRGEPVRVAGHYLHQGDANPALHVLRVYVTKIVLLWILLPALVLVHLPGIFKSPGGAVLLRAFGEIQLAMLTGLGMIAAGFWTIERYVASRWDNREWDPRDLPELPRRPDLLALPRTDTVIELVVCFAAPFWWMGYLNSKVVAVRLDGPALWLLIATALAYGALAACNLACPHWTRKRAALLMALDIASAVCLLVLLGAGRWLEFGASLTAPVVRWLDGGLQVLLAAAVVGALWTINQDARRWARIEAAQHSSSFS